MHHPNSQRGGALLTALFIMTLVAIVATAMSVRLQTDIYKTRLLVAHDKLYLASQAVLFWSFNELNQSDNKFSHAKPQGLVSTYPKNFTHIYPGVQIMGGLYDLQGAINLNNLTEKKGLVLFINLLNHVYPKATDRDKINLALTVKDWLSPYDLSKGKDSYTSYYLAQKPPYYPSHQLMRSRSEFRLLKEVNAELDQLIQPFITVLPEATPINVNTASKPVLRSLGDGLSENQVDELIQARGTKGIALKDLNPLLQKLNIPSDQTTILSQYFLSKALIKSEDLQLVVYVMLKRENNHKGKINISVLRQSFNVF